MSLNTEIGHHVLSFSMFQVISDYCQQKDQSQPFCSVIMELHAFVKSAKQSSNSNTLNKINRVSNSTVYDSKYLFIFPE